MKLDKKKLRNFDIACGVVLFVLAVAIFDIILVNNPQMKVIFKVLSAIGLLALSALLNGLCMLAIKKVSSLRKMFALKEDE